MTANEYKFTDRVPSTSFFPGSDIQKTTYSHILTTRRNGTPWHKEYGTSPTQPGSWTPFAHDLFEPGIEYV